MVILSLLVSSKEHSEIRQYTNKIQRQKVNYGRPDHSDDISLTQQHTREDSAERPI